MRCSVTKSGALPARLTANVWGRVTLAGGLHWRVQGGQICSTRGQMV